MHFQNMDVWDAFCSLVLGFGVHPCSSLHASGTVRSVFLAGSALRRNHVGCNRASAEVCNRYSSNQGTFTNLCDGKQRQKLPLNPCHDTSWHPQSHQEKAPPCAVSMSAPVSEADMARRATTLLAVYHCQPRQLDNPSQIVRGAMAFVKLRGPTPISMQAPKRHCAIYPGPFFNQELDPEAHRCPYLRLEASAARKSQALRRGAMCVERAMHPELVIIAGHSYRSMCCFISSTTRCYLCHVGIMGLSTQHRSEQIPTDMGTKCWLLISK